MVEDEHLCTLRHFQEVAIIARFVDFRKGVKGQSVRIPDLLHHHPILQPGVRNLMLFALEK